ncbi:hypothetical protein [Mameliella sediminis]|uniref:hypothetical protein n=1 Tax=Mameliella sediminis TaxID=2836866 RepID=UPI001C43CE74|nr:hypothetical protein [Mameliella sediminis]MBY6114529.1 hypothetical protein [Antarctobacter heliothermus]MBY6144102.1 hypothetical protein [Mameliella alba]MBV7392990.1 hypothetical protein [Mameliella sediminis]MBY6161606.1 hypothetical protein [Mameliella alba]MBY6169928.1 hypothetical protein [Mameliella alba]
MLLRGLPALLTVCAGLGLGLAASAQDAPVASNVTPPRVDSAPLGAPNPGAAGLLSPGTTGLPTTLWQGSDPATLEGLIRALELPVPALRAHMRVMMLAEADPPAGDRNLAHLTARLNWLEEQGLVEEALALLDITGVDDPDLFAVWADLALLLGQSAPVCRALSAQPRLSNDLSLQVFCSARDGDWNRAVLILQTAQTLGDIRGRRAELLIRFLDPELADDTPLLPPVRPTPLEFRLFEALGEPLPTAPLPLPFAVLDLNGDNGWRDQILAAERLARAGSLPANRLLGIYTLRRPAASGGVWDRVDALQDFERALNRAAPGAVAEALQKVWPQMASGRLLVPFAELYGERLAGSRLDRRAAAIARRAAFLSPAYEALALEMTDDTPETVFLTAIARGLAPAELADLPHAQAVAAGFSGAAMPRALREQLAEGKLGEVILRAMVLFNSGAAGNGQDLTDAIAAFRSLGLEDLARRAALELVILDAERARR